MKIAIEGCMHGDLDNVYRTLKYIEERAGTKIDLLLCCGDFQVKAPIFDTASSVHQFQTALRDCLFQ